MIKPFHTHQHRGFYYVEVLLSVALLAILLIPALQSLDAGIANNTDGLSEHALDLPSKMEEVLAEPFTNLYAETYQPGGNTTSSISTALSDTAGAANRRIVVLYRYDANAQSLSGNDTGLLYVSVFYEAEGSGNGLSTLKGRWW